MFVGLHRGCVPPPCGNMCVHSLGYIVGASPPLCVHSIANTVGCVPPSCVSFHWKTIFIGSLHAAYSALRHFLLNKKYLIEPKNFPQFFLTPNECNYYVILAEIGRLQLAFCQLAHAESFLATLARLLASLATSSHIDFWTYADNIKPITI